MAQAWWSSHDAILVLDFWVYGHAEPPASIVGTVSKYANHGWKFRSPGRADTEQLIWPECMPAEAEAWRRLEAAS
jgi:hypothetical protein